LPDRQDSNACLDASLLAERTAVREHSRALMMRTCHDLAKCISASRNTIAESHELLAQAERVLGNGTVP